MDMHVISIGPGTQEVFKNCEINDKVKSVYSVYLTYKKLM